MGATVLPGQRPPSELVNIRRGDDIAVRSQPRQRPMPVLCPLHRWAATSSDLPFMGATTSGRTAKEGAGPVRPGQELDTSQQEDPGSHSCRRVLEEEDAPTHRTQCDQHIASDAQRLVPTRDTNSSAPKEAWTRQHSARPSFAARCAYFTPRAGRGITTIRVRQE